VNNKRAESLFTPRAVMAAPYSAFTVSGTFQQMQNPAAIETGHAGLLTTSSKQHNPADAVSREELEF
jgi:hypothetical protein